MIQIRQQDTPQEAVKTLKALSNARVDTPNLVQEGFCINNERFVISGLLGSCQRLAGVVKLKCVHWLSL